MKTTKFIATFLVTALLMISHHVLAVKHIIHTGNFYFNPTSVSASVGDTIRWVWDGGNHTTTSSTIPSGAQTWDELITSSVQTYEYKITVAGTYNYVCTPHAGMGMVGSFTATGAAPTLSVSPTSRNVSAAPGTTTFTVTSNSSWSAVSNAAWCIVTSGGSGNGTIFADYTENTSLTSRTAVITVSVAGLPSQTVTVIQAGALPTLAVSPSNQNVSSASGSTTFSVSSNTNWQAVSNAGWCTVTPSGSGNGTINANYQENLTDQVRIATITVSVSGLPNQLVTVTQDRSTVGISDPQQIRLTVYPNPSRGIIRISLKDDFQQGKGNYQVMDSRGVLLNSGSLTGSDFSVDLSGYPDGNYLLKVDNGNTAIVRKIEIIH